MSGKSYPLPYEMLSKWATEMPEKVYLRQPVSHVMHEKNWAQVHDEVLRLTAAFLALGLKKGDVVAILAKNSAEWFITDFAISAAGLVSAPIYFTAGEDTIRYVLDHSEAKAVVVGKLDNLAPAKAAIPDDIITIALPYETLACQHQMTDLIAQHEPLSDIAKPDQDDVFSLIYTSGSTGHPKGVVVTYRNIGFGVTTGVETLKYSSSDRLISYLPLAHITERAMTEYVSLYHGCTVTFNESLETFAEDLRNAEVTTFISVPRLWAKFQAGVLTKLPQKKLNWMLKVPVLSTFIKNKVKAQLGLSNARLCGSGAAPIAPSLIEWFHSIGVEISEGFGMSETSGPVIVQYPYRHDKVGSVGYAAPGVDVKISDAGELLLRSDGIVHKYYKEPEKSAETFIDGWLHTGDKADIDEDGYIRITGRVKDLFKTGKGKYVVPGRVESLMSEDNNIEQLCVMGSGLPQPVAVVVITAEAQNSTEGDELITSLEKTLQQTNDRLEAHERVSHIIIASDDWTVENRLLTPTLKIKRNLLERKYLEVIARPYSGKVMRE